MFTLKGKRVISFLRPAAILLILTVFIGLLIIAVAALSGIDHRWADVLAQFTAPALLAAVLVLAASFALRNPRLSGVGGVVVAVLLMAVWPQWFPRRTRVDPAAPVVSLYSANLWTENTDVASIQRSIADADADIVVLVEMGGVPASQLDHILAGYPHRITTPRTLLNGRSSSALIAARYPLTGVGDGGRDGLNAIAAVVQTPLGPLNVVGVHLTRPWPFEYQWGQIMEVEALVKLRADLNGPVVVAGDFNSVSSARIGRQIQADAGLSPASAWPGTWPADVPAVVGVTIDQVYGSPDLAFVSRRLGRPTGSDHRPVITRLTLAAD